MGGELAQEMVEYASLVQMGSILSLLVHLFLRQPKHYTSTYLVHEQKSGNVFLLQVCHQFLDAPPLRTDHTFQVFVGGSEQVNFLSLLLAVLFALFLALSSLQIH